MLFNYEDQWLGNTSNSSSPGSDALYWLQWELTYTHSGMHTVVHTHAHTQKKIIKKKKTKLLFILGYKLMDFENASPKVSFKNPIVPTFISACYLLGGHTKFLTQSENFT